MKSKEIIKRLQEIDPTGEGEISIEEIQRWVSPSPTTTNVDTRRENIGVLIYKDPYDQEEGENRGRIKFFWGGEDYSDPKTFDIYYENYLIVVDYFKGDEDSYEKFLDDVLPFGVLAEMMENDYTINKTFEETVEFFEKNETGWRWVNGISDAFDD